ncbi:hypothetical protein NLI96_g4002 [Meripilus lineatus]|uniref:Uncharacterized protein n=1 Tax=Meripilus lineatus TaxID=2056292 RepID=A0AAD5V7B6_9APHY|nr:hypothetical protein NLI96_g4002 [Physisporinus lineatus]
MRPEQLARINKIDPNYMTALSTIVLRLHHAFNCYQAVAYHESFIQRNFPFSALQRNLSPRVKVTGLALAKVERGTFGARIGGTEEQIRQDLSRASLDALWRQSAEVYANASAIFELYVPPQPVGWLPTVAPHQMPKHKA